MSAFDIPQDDVPWLYFATTARQFASAVVPLFIAPLSEHVGRKPVYLVSWGLFVVFLIPSAVAKHFATIVVGRLLDGAASAQFSVMAGGTISDIWGDGHGRSLAVALFSFASVIGIALGPFIGGVIVNTKEWHWYGTSSQPLDLTPRVRFSNVYRIYVVQIIVNAGVFPILLFGVPETRYHIILSKRARGTSKEGVPTLSSSGGAQQPSFARTCKESLSRAVQMLAFEPAVISLTLWLSFVWALLFAFAQSIVQTYTTTYNYSSLQTSIVQLAISAGSLFALILSPIFNIIYMNSGTWNRECPGKVIPEARLYMALPGTICFIAGLFWYGWTLYPNLHPMLPTTGLFIIGVGIFALFFSVTTYLTDAYKDYASSALAVAAFGRNTLAAFIPLASPALFSNLGFQWASSLLGFIGIVVGLVPVLLLLWKGKVIRQHSRFIRE